MTTPMSIGAVNTAEQQLILMAIKLKEIYEGKVTDTGAVDSKYSNRVQIEIDYSGKSVALRFRLPIEFSLSSFSEVRFVGIDPSTVV